MAYCLHFDLGFVTMHRRDTILGWRLGYVTFFINTIVLMCIVNKVHEEKSLHS